MKILNVRFKNLNSLVGEWAVDFTDPAYANDGIFAITGPTGAGKTTILDAICLALYGATPRLGKITAAANEIMSRHTAECFAEVTFATSKGSYRCQWSQHRARGKAGGSLQNARHELADAATGEIKESKVGRVPDCVKEITGMDFERFTRSMMLAQGQFAAFLEARAEERAELLEDITGTQIYSDISIYVHERQRDEKIALEKLKAEISGISVLLPEEEEAMRQGLAASREVEQEKSAELKRAEADVAWLNEVAKLRNELIELRGEAEQLDREEREFAPKRELLANALRAAVLDAEYARLESLRKQQQEEESQRAGLEARLPAIEAALGASTKGVEEAQKALASARAVFQKEEPVLKEVRALDQRIETDEKRIQKERRESAAAEQEIQAQEKTLAQRQQQRSRIERDLAVTADYLKKNARDKALVSGFEALEAKVEQLAAKQEERERKEKEIEGAKEELEEAHRAKSGAERQTKDLSKKVDELKKRVAARTSDYEECLGSATLRELQKDLEAAQQERVLRAKIADLEDERAKLVDGKPCPLCGSKKHPFAEGNIPELDAVERKIVRITKQIEKAEQLKEDVQKIEREMTEARQKKSEAEKKLVAVEKDASAAQKAIEKAEKELLKVRNAAETLQKAIAEKLEPFGIKGAEEDIQAALDELETRLKAWEAQSEKQKALKEELGEIDATVKSLTSVIQTKREALSRKRVELAELEKGVEATRKAREKLFGVRNPDAEEKRWKADIDNAERNLKPIEEQKERSKEERDSVKTRLDALANSIGARNGKLVEAGEAFSVSLAKEKFQDESDFLSARLTAEERDALQRNAAELERHRAGLKSRREDRDRRLKLEEERKLTDAPLDVCVANADALRKAYEETRDANVEAQSRLKQNEEAKAAIATRQAAVNAQQRECDRWSNLDALIGSATGKKFRDFAQGLTFQIMVSHANNQLQRMTDRYLLTRNKEEPLELCVVDNYQAAEVRPTKNLSGGESFIVSLSLALGLSQMVSNKVQVDSLFLDEGFGTLDEDALDTALEALSTLQQTGKLIGVISHVSSMKDRIATKIAVEPQSGGRSVISGPGCSAA